MHPEAYRFVAWAANATHAVAPGLDLSVIEIGSLNINGSARTLFPGASYLGIDRQPGKGVDLVGDMGCRLLPFPSLRKADYVVCTEVLEHCEEAEQLCVNASLLLRSGGYLILTAAGEGRDTHSGIDGGRLRPGEFYRNVSRADLCRWLDWCEAPLIDTFSNPGDIYALARKGHLSL